MLKTSVESAFGDRMKSIWYTWLVTQLFVICYSISAMAAAAKSESVAYGFVVVWFMLMAIGYSIWGTLVLRKPSYRTPVSVGVLIGIGIMMLNISLIIAVVSNDGGHSSVKAAQVFSAFLIIMYSIFSGFTTAYRGTLIPPSMASQDLSESGLPAPSFTGYDESTGPSDVKVTTDASSVL